MAGWAETTSQVHGHRPLGASAGQFLGCALSAVRELDVRIASFEIRALQQRTMKAMSASGLRILLVDATIWLNISAGALKFSVFRGLSLRVLATEFNWDWEWPEMSPPFGKQARPSLFV